MTDHDVSIQLRRNLRPHLEIRIRPLGPLGHLDIVLQQDAREDEFGLVRGEEPPRTSVPPHTKYYVLSGRAGELPLLAARMLVGHGGHAVGAHAVEAVGVEFLQGKKKEW